jgi:glycosyltransferase involved in cell wall biosynthesis
VREPGVAIERSRADGASGPVAHVSIVHPPEDARIYVRQCRSLAAAGHEVHLVVGGTANEVRDGVHLHGLSRRWERPGVRQQWLLQCRALRQGWKLRAAVYHLHEPQLIPTGIAFMLRGARVVYDVHEDYPRHARCKHRDRPVVARVKGGVWAALEFVALRTFHGFVCATDEIAARFPVQRTQVIHNYPSADERTEQLPYSERPPNVVFLGVQRTVRGIWQALESISLLPERLGCKLLLVGRFGPPSVLAKARRHPGWARVEYVPWLPRAAALRMLLRARIGLVALHRVDNQLRPDGSNKLYEYMAAGLPVVTSDAPAWRRLVEDVGCGLAVDPLDAGAIAEAVRYLLANPSEAEEMGRRGQAAVAARFNWESETDRLLDFYGTLNGGPV